MPMTPADPDRAQERSDILLLLALSLLCYADKILLGPYAVIDFYDTLEVHFSHFRAMWRLWADFGAFSWYPFHAGGAPSFVGQHPPYHPGVLLSGGMPIWLLALLWNVGQMFLAGYGMYRMLPMLLGVSRRVGLFCGAVYSIVWVSGNVHMVLPYAFPAVFAWTSDLFRPDSPRLRRLGAALLILAVFLFSYPVLTLPHFPVVHLALLLFLGRDMPWFKRQVAGVFAVWTAYVLLFVPSIVSLFLYVPFAQRNWDFGYPGLAPALRDFLLWVRGRLADQPTLGLLLFALPLARVKGLRACFALLAAMVVVSGVFSSELKGLFIGSFLLKMDLFMFATAIGVIIMLIAALAMEHLVSGGGVIRWWYVGVVIVLLTTFGAANKVLAYCMLLGATLCAVTVMRRDAPGTKRRAQALAAAGVMVCLACAGMMIRQQYMSSGMFVPYAKGYLGHPELDRLAGRARGLPLRVACIDIHPAVVQAHGLDTVGGKSPLFNRWYKEYLREAMRPQFKSEKDVVEFDNLWRQLYLTRNHTDHDQRQIALPAESPRRADDFDWPLLRAMNVTHVAASAPVQGLDALCASVTASPALELDAWPLRLLGLDRLHAQPLWLYELKEPMGLARVGRPVLLDSEEQVLAALGAAGERALREEVRVARADAPELGPAARIGGGSPGQVRLERWSPDRLVFSGSSEPGAVLLVPNNYDPRWSVRFADGTGGRVFRADHAFQGVRLPGGEFRLELGFSAPLIWQLHAACAAGLLLLFSGLGLGTRPGAPVRPEPYRSPGPVVPWPRTLLLGAAAAGVWALLFALFVLGRRRPPQAETYAYALATIPLMGVCLACWCRSLLRRL